MPRDAAFITWIDLTASDRDKVRRVLDLFNEKGTVDELGLGGIRDFISDALFPGTSILHTRLRYVLFIPWLYKFLESRYNRIRDIEHEARNLETQLINALKNHGEQKGIIGVESGQSLSRLPSNIYWSALVRWNIFVPNQSQSWYHKHFKQLARPVRHKQAEDAELMFESQATWHPHLPRFPESLLQSASFELSEEESEFIRGCIETNVSGSLLSWLAREGSSALASAEWCWEALSVWHAPAELQEIVELARRFSLHVEGAPLLYNLLLAETRRTIYGDHSGTDEAWIEHYRAALAKWAEKEAQEEGYNPEKLWAEAARRGAQIKAPLKDFIESWSQGLARCGPGGVADSRELRELIAYREKLLKGSRARLVNRNRLLDWKGDTGVGRLSFRWPNVRRILTDLHEGLSN